MNYIVCLFFLAFLSSQCQKKQTAAQDQIQWNKIVIKDELAVDAIYGNIYDRLIIGANLKILKTVDSGKTWITVAGNLDQIREFTANGDTLFAVSDGKDYFSLNNGDTWQLLAYDRVRRTNPNQISTSKGYLYKFVGHSQGEDALPAEVLMSFDQGMSWKNVFPFKHYITSIYADKQDKIYMGAFGVTWDENRSTFLALKNPVDAIIYYTHNSK